MHNVDWLFAFFAMGITFFYGLINYDFSNGLCNALVILIIELLYRISKKNPFDRNLRHRMYEANRSPLNHYDRTIRFSKGATLDSLHEAIFDAMYQTQHAAWEYRNPSISFDNFIQWNSIAASFKPFYFSTISFDNVEPDTFQCRDFLLLPCEQLFLPRRLMSIDFLGYEIPHIKEIVITSPHFVSLVPHLDFSAQPFKSPAPLNISVPQNLLAQYRTDPSWASLRLVDEDGNVNSATFNGLPPIDPSVQSRCIHC